VAELESAIEAIKIAKRHGIRQLEINTDSDYMIKAVDRWMPNWKNNGWRTANGGHVRNREEFMELDYELNGRVDVDWVSSLLI
jgi:ribonuclease HI